jgi:type II secretory pathway component PulJ
MLTLGRHGASESGFTLIELLVGMLLAVLVLGAAMLALTSMFTGATERSVDRKAMSRAADALERFERDMRGAESPERLNTPVVRDEMRAIVLWGVSKHPSGGVASIGPANPCPAGGIARDLDYCRFQDVTVSHANQVYFRADVDAANPGHECVSWRVQGGALWRRVTRDHTRCWTDSTGAELSNEEVLPAPASGTVGNAQGRSASFGYLVRFNPASDGPGQYNTIVDPQDCRSYSYFPLTTNLNDMRRGFITNVTLDLSAWTTGGDATGTGSKNSARQRLISSATITSRANDDFAYATGCGQ